MRSYIISRISGISRTRPKVFYGWWIVLAGAAISAVNGGVYFYGFGTFFTPLVNEFGWTRTALAGAFSLSRLEGGLMGPMEGWLTDRLGPRRLMLFGAGILGLGFILMSRVNSLPFFYVVFILFLTLGSSFGMGVTISTAVANWFVKKRSRALGLTMAGFGGGGLIVPLLGWLIAEYGWRAAAQMAGIAVWVVCIPLALVMRHKPEQYGCLPDGDTADTSPASPPLPAREKRSWLPFMAAIQSQEESEVNFTAREALRTAAFWLLAITLGLRIMVSSTVVVHLVPLLIDAGVSPQGAAVVLGAVGTISVVGRLFFGWLGDFSNKRYLTAFCFSLIVISLFVLSSTRTVAQAVLFVAIYAPAYGGTVPLMTALRGEYFGRKAFGTIHGFSGMVSMVGTVIGPIFAGYVFDVTGSYRLAFLIISVATALAIGLVLAARRPQLREGNQHTLESRDKGWLKG
ncbi:MAG: MFS transporter [Chloroflexi bacterium]|nr:MFS transporter [Chloroflexota bacterium]